MHRKIRQGAAEVIYGEGKTAEQIVHKCIYKGYGLSRAKQALYEKRIPKEYWEEALADYPDQMEKILSFLRSRLDASGSAFAICINTSVS